MAKRNNTRVPPFPARWESRYFGSYSINDANRWTPFDEYLEGCAPAADRILFEPLDLPDMDQLKIA